MPRRLPQPSYDQSPPHEAILKSSSWPPKRSQSSLDYGKTIQVKLPHLRKSSVSQKRTREHSKYLPTVIGGTLSLPNRSVRFPPKANISCRQSNVLSANSGHSTIHSITSSAMENTPGGTSTPSARAVCRLMTSSNLFNCSTGSSAGLAPLRILPV
jgi:hypothetical protein